MITDGQAVVASVLHDSKMLRVVMGECVPRDFNDLRVGAIYSGMIAMAAAQEPIDVMSVSDKLRSWDVRGITSPDLFKWMEEVPSPAHAKFYAKSVRTEALRRGVRTVATRIVQSSAGDPSACLQDAMKDLRDLAEDHVITGLHAKALGDVLVGDTDYDWVIEGLLEKRDRLLLTGNEGGGKSTMIRQLAILSAAGIHPFTFLRMPPVKVLVVDAENSEKQWRRAARAIVTKAATRGSVNPADAVELACVPRLDLTKDSDLGEVHRLVDAFKPDVLFIGPLYRLIPRAINNDDDATPLLVALDTLRERGPALVIEAHAGHSIGAGGERDLRPRGSAALLGWPEFGFGLRPDRNGKSSNDFRLVRWRGDRDERAWPTRVSRGLSDWPWTPTDRFQGR